MSVLVVGLGSIGRRHLANLQVLQPAQPVVVWHQHTGPGDYRSESSDSVRHVFTVADALEAKPTCALITGPATLHIDAALALAGHDVHLFIEKPLSHTLDGVDRLLDVCRDRRLVLQVGYNYRFYQPLQLLRQAIRDGKIGRVLSVRAEVGQYLPDWRPNADYRQGVTARRDLGGGVVLELSHEIDYVRWLVGEVTEVSARIGHLSELEIDVEDTAEITLMFANGALGSVHLDMVQRCPTRGCKVVGTAGTLTWDSQTHHVRWYSSHSEQWTDLCAAGTRDRNDAYLSELRHFFECVATASRPAVDGEDGRRVLEILLAIKQSSLDRRVVAV